MSIELYGKWERPTCRLLTAVDGGSPADPADGLAWSVGVRGGGGDQVVVHITVKTRLLSRRLLLHLGEADRMFHINY